MTEMIPTDLASPCGLYCGECLHFEKPCKGCIPSNGQPAWGRCPTFACSREKSVEHCGECTEFPCNRYLKQYSRQLGPWRVFYKTGQLVYRKKIGTAKWVKEKAEGKNPDPKIAVERCLQRDKIDKKKEKNTSDQTPRTKKRQSLV